MMAWDLESYQKVKQELIDKDQVLRRDRILIRNATDLEKRADEVLRRLRKDEAESTWNEDSHGSHLFPGMEFLTAKGIIDRTSVFRLIRKMPKGGLLHIHLGATVKAEVLLSIALEHPQMHIKSSSHFLRLDGTSKQPLPVFWAFATKQPCTMADIAHPSYVPDTWVPLQDAREQFSLGTEEFDQWIIRALMINPSEAYGTHNTVSKIWEKFDETFLVSEGLLLFFPVWKLYLREFLSSSVDDGIAYIEVSFNFPTMIHVDCATPVTGFDFLQLFDETVTEFKGELEQQGRDGEFIGAKLIYSCLRFVSREEMSKSLDACLQMKLKYPELIAGITLVGDENRHKPLHYYSEQLLNFKQKQVEMGVDIPFLFHAGETLGDGDEPDSNLFDALAMGTKRIGHGFSISKHPELMRFCREHEIALEVCPISNEILRLTTSIPMHPISNFVNNGLPVVLGSDDPAMFGNMGLSYDFFQVFMSSEITSLFTLKCFARDSLQFSMLEPAERAHALALWEGKWNQFVNDILIDTNRV